MIRSFTHHLAVCGSMILIAAALGCSTSETAIAPSGDPSTYFDHITLNTRALNMSTVAPYDTFRLRVDGRLANGAPVTTPVEYFVNDTLVTVDSTGLITARHPTSPGSYVYVRATQRYQGGSRKDSVFISIIDTAPTTKPVRLSLQFSPDPQRMTVGVGEGRTYTTAFYDARDSVVPGLLADIRSADTTIGFFDAYGGIDGSRPGTVVLYTSAIAFGTLLRDSMIVRVTWPTLTTLHVIENPDKTGAKYTLDLDSVKIGVGGIAQWDISAILLDDPYPHLDIVFDDSVHVGPAIAQIQSSWGDTTGSGPGNIPPFGLPANFSRQSPPAPDPVDGSYDKFLAWESVYESTFQRARSFPVAGRYPFHSRLMPNIHGVVLVCDSPSLTCP